MWGKRFLFLLSENVVHERRGGGRGELQDTTRMSMVVVQEALCVYAGSAWALWGRSLYEGVRGCEVTWRNDVAAACLTTVSVWSVIDETIRS